MRFVLAWKLIIYIIYSNESSTNTKMGNLRIYYFIDARVLGPRCYQWKDTLLGSRDGWLASLAYGTSAEVDTDGHRASSNEWKRPCHTHPEYVDKDGWVLPQQVSNTFSVCPRHLQFMSAFIYFVQLLKGFLWCHYCVFIYMLYLLPSLFLVVNIAC